VQLSHKIVDLDLAPSSKKDCEPNDLYCAGAAGMP